MPGWWPSLLLAVLLGAAAQEENALWDPYAWTSFVPASENCTGHGDFVAGAFQTVPRTIFAVFGSMDLTEPLADASKTSLALRMWMVICDTRPCVVPGLTTASIDIFPNLPVGDQTGVDPPVVYRFAYRVVVGRGSFVEMAELAYAEIGTKCGGGLDACTSMFPGVVPTSVVNFVEEDVAFDIKVVDGTCRCQPGYGGPQCNVMNALYDFYYGPAFTRDALEGLFFVDFLAAQNAEYENRQLEAWYTSKALATRLFGREKMSVDGRDRFEWLDPSLDASLVWLPTTTTTTTTAAPAADTTNMSNVTANATSNAPDSSSATGSATTVPATTPATTAAPAGARRAEGTADAEYRAARRALQGTKLRALEDALSAPHLLEVLARLDQHHAAERACATVTNASESAPPTPTCVRRLYSQEQRRLFGTVTIKPHEIGLVLACPASALDPPFCTEDLNNPENSQLMFRLGVAMGALTFVSLVLNLLTGTKGITREQKRARSLRKLVAIACFLQFAARAITYIQFDATTLTLFPTVYDATYDQKFMDAKAKIAKEIQERARDTNAPPEKDLANASFVGLTMLGGSLLPLEDVLAEALATIEAQAQPATNEYDVSGALSLETQSDPILALRMSPVAPYYYEATTPETWEENGDASYRFDWLAGIALVAQATLLNSLIQLFDQSLVTVHRRLRWRYLVKMAEEGKTVSDVQEDKAWGKAKQDGWAYKCVAFLCRALIKCVAVLWRKCLRPCWRRVIVALHGCVKSERFKRYLPAIPPEKTDSERVENLAIVPAENDHDGDGIPDDEDSDYVSEEPSDASEPEDEDEEDDEDDEPKALEEDPEVARQRREAGLLALGLDVGEIQEAARAAALTEADVRAEKRADSDSDDDGPCVDAKQVNVLSKYRTQNRLTVELHKRLKQCILYNACAVMLVQILRASLNASDIILFGAHTLATAMSLLTLLPAGLYLLYLQFKLATTLRRAALIGSRARTSPLTRVEQDWETRNRRSKRPFPPDAREPGSGFHSRLSRMILSVFVKHVLILSFCGTSLAMSAVRWWTQVEWVPAEVPEELAAQFNNVTLDSNITTSAPVVATEGTTPLPEIFNRTAYEPSAFEESAAVIQIPPMHYTTATLVIAIPTGCHLLFLFCAFFDIALASGLKLGRARRFANGRAGRPGANYYGCCTDFQPLDPQARLNLATGAKEDGAKDAKGGLGAAAALTDAG